MPPKGKDHNPSGLGRAIINRKVKDAHRAESSGMYSVDTNTPDRLKSVTQQGDLDEFMSVAQLAGTDFTAERRNVKIIQGSTSPSHNPHLLTEEEEESVLQKYSENKEHLRIPRRPPWTRDMTPAQLDTQEKAAFLDWRRKLAQLQDQENLLFTPFERNLEVWRQLWRVIERAHLVVQIVDARNPLNFRCEDLDLYVKDVEGPEGEHGSGEGKRRSLLLINKADLLTMKQRRQWADYLDGQNIHFAFFSAANAAAIQSMRREAALAESLIDSHDEEQSSSGSEEDDVHPRQPGTEDIPPELSSDGSSSDDDDDDSATYLSAEEDDPVDDDPRSRVLSVLELEDLFLKIAPPLHEFTDADGKIPPKLTVGLVGYPNVGKSSTINALLGEKKVSVSSTPGKTKHFQTIHLSESIILCDCPGLVFPQFATTKAHLVCDGVLPIDQMREYTGPISLLIRRIPLEILEATYGLSIKTNPVQEGGDGKASAENFLIAYAVGRGYTRSGQGNPDEAKAARYILKDYVNGKLLYAHPPPTLSAEDFNADSHALSLERAVGKKQAPLTRVGQGADTFIPYNPHLPSGGSDAPVPSNKANRLDSAFFTPDSSLSDRPFVQGRGGTAQEFSRSQLYPHQNAVADDGTPLGNKHARLASVLIAGESKHGKKHHKKPKREKQRSGRGYD